MNSDSLILRQNDYSPLTNKADYIDSDDLDGNFINLFKDLLALSYTGGVDAYSVDTTYDDTITRFATYSGRTYLWINASPGSGVTPGTDDDYWQEVFPAIMAHPKNQDTKLGEGTAYEVTAQEIKEHIGTTEGATNLDIGSKTATTLEVTSSTGNNVTLPVATQVYAGLLSAAYAKILAQTSGRNTGDQTLASLNAEDVDNKATDFSIINDTLYPSIQAVKTYIQSLINTEPFEVVCGTKDADISVSSDIGAFVVPYNIENIEISMYLRTAPTGSDAIFDVLLNGVSIIGSGDLLTVDAGTNDSTLSVATVNLAVTQADARDVVTVDCTQIGATVAGKNPIFIMTATKRVD